MNNAFEEYPNNGKGLMAAVKVGQHSKRVDDLGPQPEPSFADIARDVDASKMLTIYIYIYVVGCTGSQFSSAAMTLHVDIMTFR